MVELKIKDVESLEAIVRALQKNGYPCNSFIHYLAEIISSGDYQETFKMAASALRPVSREQVEKAWRGEWVIQQDEHKEYIKRCSKCGFPISGWWGEDKFCANCGAPMTDEAVDMVMERMEALSNGIDT